MPDARRERTVILGHEGLRELGGFTQLPNFILKHQDLSFGGKVAFGVLLSYAWQKDFCFPAQTQLARDLSCTVRQVQRLLSELKLHQLLDWKQIGLNRPNLYILLPHGLPPGSSAKNKDATNPSLPDATDLSGLDPTNTSPKEYAEKNTKNVNVAQNSPLGSERPRQTLEYLVLEMIDVLGDSHSAGFYRRVAATIPSDVIFSLLSDTKDRSRRREIRVSRGAYFTNAVLRYASQHGYDLGVGLREAA